MKVLWVTNVPLPEASLLMGDKPLPFGGWLINAANQLAKEKNLKLEIAFPKSGMRTVQVFKGDILQYYAFPFLTNSNDLLIDGNPELLNIIEHSKPDIIHIFGTEFTHTLAMVNVCQKKRIACVISIQGLVSFIAKHYMNGLPLQIQNQFTIRDLLKMDNIKMQQKKLINRGKFEIEALQKVEHVIGRTNWDYACTKMINPTAVYHHCNETLRTEFYRNAWEFENCEQYSIFVSQGSYPIKGLHFILEAMPIILKRFPTTKLYIGGSDITRMDSLKQKLKASSYGKYIKRLIEEYDLRERLVFTGVLDEKQMCQQYVKSHVFVCPSTIENSPNSLGEAMILGVPSVASDVGGISDLLTHKEEGYVYQADAPYMLAYYICDIFENRQLAEKFSKKAREKAEKLHDRELNHQRLIEIYKEIGTACSSKSLPISKGLLEESVGFEEEVGLYK